MSRAEGRPEDRKLERAKTDPLPELFVAPPSGRSPRPAVVGGWPPSVYRVGTAPSREERPDLRAVASALRAEDSDPVPPDRPSASLRALLADPVTVRWARRQIVREARRARAGVLTGVDTDGLLLGSLAAPSLDLPVRTLLPGSSPGDRPQEDAIGGERHLLLAGPGRGREGAEEARDRLVRSGARVPAALLLSRPEGSSPPGAGDDTSDCTILYLLEL